MLPFSTPARNWHIGPTREQGSVKHGVAGKTALPQRRRRILRDSIRGITRPSLRRLARRGGVSRMSASIYDEARSAMQDYLRNVLRICVTYVEHRNSRTVSTLDVIHALHSLGRTLYGFDPDCTVSKSKKLRLRT